MNPTSPANTTDPEPTVAPAAPAPSVSSIREMRNGAAIGRTSVATIQSTDAANAVAIPTRVHLR